MNTFIENGKYESKLTLNLGKNKTNLRLWTGRNKAGKHLVKDHDTIFIRLDSFQQYSVPLHEDVIFYVEDEYADILKKLIELGGFMIPILKMEEVLEITKKLKPRELLSW